MTYTRTIQLLSNQFNCQKDLVGGVPALERITLLLASRKCCSFHTISQNIPTVIPLYLFDLLLKIDAPTAIGKCDPVE